MKEVRFGIIGIGNMGTFHARTLLEGKVPRAKLVAICDIQPEALARLPDVPSFPSAQEMIDSGQVDAVLIATPHYSHTTIGIATLKAGLHVLVEKPISVHKADCESLIAAYQPGRQIFAAMFNQRTDSYYTKIRELICSGELGALRRIQWTVTNWFRSQAYYDSGGWRATWSGEGGGVLLNQCPHNLDLWQWLFGMPDQVRAFATLGRYHSIEVEDDVTAYLQYKDGTTGVFITSTGEAPGSNRLEIAAERGRLVLENDRLTFTRNEISMSEFSHTTKTTFAAPPTWDIQIPVQGHGPQHTGILINFVAAILDGATLLSPAPEGVHSVELANAMLLSSAQGETVSLPLDAAKYEKWLRLKMAESKAKKEIVPGTAPDDFNKSFNT